jgi:NAD(P)-dependent dehydrogenase (short-subunit alcohol dehydrogenase family)
VIAACDQVFDERELARVVVIGSESGFSGSYDSAYAAAKAGLHAYVETKRLKPRQQLVCVAPGIIADAGMTTRRPDKDALAARALEHPKRRFVTALEVAKLIRFLLYDDIGYLSGITIRMNGGQHTCR